MSIFKRSGAGDAVDDTPTDAIPTARHAARPGLPRFIRAFAIPIVLVSRSSRC
jgi:putative drug exporter of the RND superfamily